MVAASSKALAFSAAASGSTRRLPSCPRARRTQLTKPVKALEIDWSDTDTWIGLAGAVLGLGLGIGAPIFYGNRIDDDEKNLEDLRKLNRDTFKETGEYLSEEEIAQIRTPRWTDRREFVDDD